MAFSGPSQHLAPIQRDGQSNTLHQINLLEVANYTEAANSKHDCKSVLIKHEVLLWAGSQRLLASVAYALYLCKDSRKL